MKQNQFSKTLRASMTDAERILWTRLRAHRLNGEKFRRQQPIGPYIVDFVHLGARLIVEADGGQHNESASDERRDAWLKQQGFRVMRFWNHQIMGETDTVLAAILSAVSAPTFPSPSAPLPHGERGGKRA